ncbi:MAG: HEAT repeat domain-containing protein [Syntrophobacteria bacterium]
MDDNRIVEFRSRERLLQKAREYVAVPELFLQDYEKAIPLLLKALKCAQRELKLEIMLLLGSFAKEEVVWPLYEILSDNSEDEEVRHDAAVQLSVIGPFLKNAQVLIDRLLQDMRSQDAELRLHTTFAAGWEGNSQAAISLIERLYDPDIRVQQTAVSALCNLRDERILDMLLERLEHGPLEQKRCILFNLWRFYSKQEAVAPVYLKYLEHENADLRFDALVLLRQVAPVEEHLPVYGKCLKDENEQIRKLALKRLAEEGGRGVLRLKEEIAELVNDPNMEVKRTAIKLLKNL